MGHSHIDFKFWTDAKHTRQRQNMVLLPCVYLSSLQKIVVLKPASGPLYEFYAISTEMAVPHKLQCYQLFNTSTRLDLTKHHWWGCNTWKVRPVHYIKFMSFQQKWRIQVTISFWFSCTVLCYFNKMLYHVNYGVFQHSIYLHGLIWPSITDEDWIPETRVRSILSILCDFNKMAYHKLQCYPVFNTSTWLDLAKHHWWGFKTWNARPVHYIYFMRFQQKWRIQVIISLLFCFCNREKS